MTSTAVICASALTAGMAHAQRDHGPDMTIDAATRSEAIESLLKALNKDYVFPDTAKKIDSAIRAHVAAKEYDGLTSAYAFSEKLTDDLQAVSHDKHLRVWYSTHKLPEGNLEAPPAEVVERMRKEVSARNYGFARVERMEGNIGYLDLRGFAPPEFAGDTAAAAMNFLSNSDALIVDLRQNGGGDPAMVALLCSYLFPSEPVHLNDLYWRPSDETQQWWTLPYVPGKRYLDKPVYVLTSKRTFSGAEEFTYNLKNLKRATIVGETTGGGAHPGGPARLGDHFSAFIPSGRAINPITKTNWEGTGVEPDVKVPADDALKTAQSMALKKLSLTKTDSPLDQERADALTALEKSPSQAS